MRESETLGWVPENFEILELIEIPGRVGILNNSLKPTPLTISKDRRSRTIIRAIPSVISFGLRIFRVSFCTCDKFHIDSVSFLVHVLMFGCIRFRWRNKPVVLAYLVLNSWWQCVHSTFVSSFSRKRSQTELLFTFFLCTISSALHYFLPPQLYSHCRSTLFLKIFNLY